MSLSKLNLLYSVYQKLLLRKIKDDTINCGNSALQMWCWSNTEQLILRKFFPSSFFKNQWYITSLEKWPDMNCSKCSSTTNHLFHFVLYLFISEKTLAIFLGLFTWQSFLWQIMTHRGKHAYRFAVFVFLQKAHHWAAFLWESDLSVSAHFHSPPYRRKKIRTSFSFFLPSQHWALVHFVSSSPLHHTVHALSL